MQERAIIFIICILGCLELSIAHSRSRRANGTSDDELLEHPVDMKTRKLIHVRMENTHRELNEILVKQCWNRGIPQPYPNYYTVLRNITECVKSEAGFTLDLEQLYLEVNYPEPQNSWKEMVEKTCRTRDEIEACSRPAATSFNVCYDAAELKAMERTRNISRAIIDYICSDDGVQLLAYINDRKCVKQSTRALVECVTKLGSLPENKRVGNQKGENDFLAFMKFENGQCSQFEQVRRCAINELEKCNDQRSASFMDGVIGAARVSACSGASESWRTSSTLVSVATVVLAYLKLA